jgi:hypothetical protein
MSLYRPRGGSRHKASGINDAIYAARGGYLFLVIVLVFRWVLVFVGVAIERPDVLMLNIMVERPNCFNFKEILDEKSKTLEKLRSTIFFHCLSSSRNTIFMLSAM